MRIKLIRSKFKYVRLIPGFILVLLLPALSTAVAGQSDTLYILQTTDVHGVIQPYNYFTDEAADNGLARIYTRVTEYRKKHDNVLLVDGGDILQGTPLAYYFNKIETTLPHPLILTMNYMGYDAFAVGNHDVEQGLFVYERARRESDFPWLSANGIMPDGRTYFEPYTIIEINDIRVGIIGLTTPAIPMWLDSALYPGITWEDMVESAAYWSEELSAHVDVLVGLFHAGLNASYSESATQALGLPNENASRRVAEQVPGFDIIFAGHSHRAAVNPDREISKITHAKNESSDEVLFVNAGSRAQNLGVVQIVLSNEGDAGYFDWKIKQKSAWLEPMQDVPAAPAIMQLSDYYHKKTLDYIRTEIAELSDTLSSRQSRYKDTPFVELINQSQLNYTDADFSFAAAFNDRFVLRPGPVTIKDVYGMYWYENFLYVVEMTGRQIRDFLEYSARYFIIKNGTPAPNPEMQGYNYDMAEGLRYRINLNKEPGQRIENLRIAENGQPLDMDATYRVALNSYRATGGGGHMAAAGAEDAPVIFKSSEDIRNILIDYIKNQGVIKPQADGNWRLVWE